jgi:hypothetical protein
MPMELSPASHHEVANAKARGSAEFALEYFDDQVGA